MSKQPSYFSKGGISEETEKCSRLARHHLWQQQEPQTPQLPSPVTEVAWDVVTSGADWDWPDLQTLHSEALYLVLLATELLVEGQPPTACATGLPCSK